MSWWSLFQAIILALFGVVSLAVAVEAILKGRVTFKGEESRRDARPAAFWLFVTLYFAFGLASLAGVAWAWWHPVPT